MVASGTVDNASYIVEAALYELMVDTDTADSSPYIIESDVYGLMTELCTANVAIGFLITANGKQAGYFYILALAYGLANLAKTKYDTYSQTSIA